VGNESTCCFIGDQTLPRVSIEPLIKRLDYEIENLIGQNVTTFISGGALGFDMIATALVVFKKECYSYVRLCFALPCREFTQSWREDQKRFLQQLQEKADQVIHVGGRGEDDVKEEQYRYVIDQAAYCLYASLNPTEVIEQSLRYARQRKLKMIDAADKQWSTNQTEQA
jgi:uncharacterized phage-like protein YoqJ